MCHRKDSQGRIGSCSRRSFVPSDQAWLNRVGEGREDQNPEKHGLGHCETGLAAMRKPECDKEPVDEQ